MKVIKKVIFISLAFMFALTAKAETWSYIVNPSQDYLTMCVSPDGVKLPSWRSCYGDGTCHNAEAIIDKCRSLYEWTYVVNMENNGEKDHMTMCISPEGEAFGNWRNCYEDGTCHNAEAIRNLCRQTYGWLYIVNPEKTYETMCISPEGKEFGNWRSCYEDGTCHNAEAIRDLCREVYGSGN